MTKKRLCHSFAFGLFHGLKYFIELILIFLYFSSSHIMSEYHIEEYVFPRIQVAFLGPTYPFLGGPGGGGCP